MVINFVRYQDSKKSRRLNNFFFIVGLAHTHTSPALAAKSRTQHIEKSVGIMIGLNRAVLNEGELHDILHGL